MPGWIAPIASILLKAVAAGLVLFIGLKSKLPRIQKVLIHSVAAAIFLAAIADGIIERQHERAEKQGNAVQSSIKDSVAALQDRAVQEQQEQQARAAHNEKLKSVIGPLILKGIAIKNRCSNPGGDARYHAWTKHTEHTLMELDPVAGEEFKSAEGPFICFQQMDVEISALNSIQGNLHQP